MEDREQRIRNIAYRIWEEEGRLVGEEERHWQMAAYIVDQEDAERAGLVSKTSKTANDDERGSAESYNRPQS